MQNARITAINALIKMENDDAYSNIVIDTALTKSGLNRRLTKLLEAAEEDALS